MTIKMAFVVAAAHAALKSQAAKINALNVYPVPDGDTGTNMLLTLESVLAEASNASYKDHQEASKAGARAALMGARGNSGVILSQMIRGASDVLAKRAPLTAEAFTEALEGAWERAHASIREPVEGTMLTVAKDASQAAKAALEKGADLQAVIRAAAQEAHASVKRTPELLSVLRDAGVVDAGGLGVAVILDGLYSCVSGQKIELQEEAEDSMPNLDAMHANEEAWGYCTEFLVTGFSGDASEFEDHIHSIGESVLVIPDDDLVKVHLHTQDPGDAMSYAGTFGRLAGIKVDDMEDQVRVRSDSTEDTPVEPKDLAVVVASRGQGSRKLYESMGALVIEGGQGANPSAAEFADAVERSGAKAAILLPNNKNIVPTVEQVGELVEAETFVIPTTSIAGGLAVMVGFDAEGEPDEVVAEMRETSEAMKSGEVTQAVRKAKIEGHKVPKGAYIGLLDGSLVAVEDSIESAALKLAESVVEEGADVITLLRGEDLGEEALEKIAAGISELDEDVEVEVHDGGQPMYPIQMVAE